MHIVMMTKGEKERKYKMKNYATLTVADLRLACMQIELYIYSRAIPIEKFKALADLLRWKCM